MISSDQNFSSVPRPTNLWSFFRADSPFGQQLPRGIWRRYDYTDDPRSRSTSHCSGGLTCSLQCKFARDLQERLGILALFALLSPFRMCKLQIPLAERETDPVSGHHIPRNLGGT